MLTNLAKVGAVIVSTVVLVLILFWALSAFVYFA